MINCLSREKEGGTSTFVNCTIIVEDGVDSYTVEGYTKYSIAASPYGYKSGLNNSIADVINKLDDINDVYLNDIDKDLSDISDKLDTILNSFDDMSNVDFETYVIEHKLNDIIHYLSANTGS